jgi:hypothetical protein
VSSRGRLVAALAIIVAGVLLAAALAVPWLDRQTLQLQSDQQLLGCLQAAQDSTNVAAATSRCLELDAQRQARLRAR